MFLKGFYGFARLALACAVLLSFLTKTYGDEGYRHINKTKKNVSYSYGGLNVMYPYVFKVNGISSLSLPLDNDFLKTVFDEYNKSSSGSELNTEKTMSLTNQKIGISLFWGKKLNSPFRYDYALTFMQASEELLGDFSYVKTNSDNTTSTVKFSNIDVLARYLGAMFNLYYDFDFNKFKVYVGAGAGLYTMFGSIRGNNTSTTGNVAASVDFQSTKQKVRKFGISSALHAGIAKDIGSNISLNLFVSQFSNIGSGDQKSSSFGSVSEPAGHKIKVVGLGLTYKFGSYSNSY